MSDHVGGIAILDERENGARLHFVCVRTDGRPNFSYFIGVRPRGTPEKPGTYTWEIAERGDTLDVQPSVRVYLPARDDVPETELFHNAGQWSVRFERWRGEPGDYPGIIDRLAEINPGLSFER